MRMRQNVQSVHGPPLQRQGGTLRRAISLGNAAVLFGGCALSWPPKWMGALGPCPTGDSQRRQFSALGSLCVSWVLWPCLCMPPCCVSGNVGFG